jgi:hypothetical protein
MRNLAFFVEESLLWIVVFHKKDYNFLDLALLRMKLLRAGGPGIGYV